MLRQTSPLTGLSLAIILGLSLLTPKASRANYAEFPDVGNAGGADIVVQELRWPYWNGGYYNTWTDSYLEGSDGVSDQFYSGVPLPAAGSPTKAGINYSFWSLSNPLHPTDTISSKYSSPTTFPKQTIAEGTVLEDPGQWYFWQTNTWYRVAFRVWQPADGTPHLGYAGEWLRDGASGIWYHIATAQTPFAVTSVNAWSGFQEDIGGGSTQPERTDFRRLYYRHNGVWKSGTNFHDYNQNGTNNQAPGYGMVDNAGLIANSVDGTNAAVYLETCQKNPSYVGTITNQGNGPSYVINQPATPAFFDPILVTNYSGSVTNGQLLVQWQMLNTSSPQFAYQINVYTNAGHTGTVAATFYDNDPETRQKLLNIPAGITPYPQLTIVDVFNQTNAPVSVTVTNASLLAATTVSGVVGGLNFAYYESASNYQIYTSGTNWSSMPDFSSLTPILDGAVSGLDLTPRRRRDGYAFNYTGYINVANNGLYAFTLNSDAGSKLYVDGQLVVNHDGQHSPADLSGWVGLQAGYHTLNVQYFCDTQPFGGYYYDSISLAYEGPSITKTEVPVTAYSRVPGGSEPSISLMSPVDGTTLSGASVPLSATVTANGNTINQVLFFNGDNYWAQDTAAPYTASSLFWDSNNNPIRARLYYNGTNIIDSPVNVVNTTNQTLDPWQFGQIFFHDYPSGASIQSGTYSLIGDGVDLLTRQVSGDCTIIAHLAGLPGTAAAPDGSVAESGWQAGIILRGTTNLVQGYPWGKSGVAPFVAVFGQVGGGTYYQDEGMANGGGGYSISVTSGKWFKLVRTDGTNFTTFVSANGSTWTQVGNTNLTDFGTTIYVGMFTYAEPDNNLYVPWAKFDNVSITGNILGPPTVNVTPAADTAYAGQSTTFTALPGGNAPFNYQWQLNGANLVGATNATLTLTNLQSADSGIYTVLLTNANGNASATTTLTVLPPIAPVSAILSNNPIGYWRLNEAVGPTAYDSAANNNGTGEGNVIFGVTGVTNAPFTGFEPGNLGAQFNGADSDVALPAFNLNTANFTITGWVKRSDTQTNGAALVFCRSGSTISGLNFGSGNQLAYHWNNSGYTWGSGLVPPDGVWTFVAMTVDPTRTILYMSTNGVLLSATNNLANPTQTFTGATYLGYDPIHPYYRLNGALDEVAIFNQTLTPVQLGAILSASQAAAPVAISLTTPSNGANFGSPAIINLTASVVTNGHTINYVPFYNGATLLGVSSNAPYNFTWTNVTPGSYTVFAQAVYDGTNTMSSAPAFITVNPVPAAPATITPVALSGNLVSVTWPVATFADGYILSRNGTAIAWLAGTNYSDFGLAANTTYSYFVVATNLYENSPPSVTNSVNTIASGVAFWWDAGGSMGGAQDGNGIWGNSSMTWWDGAENVAWTDGNLAIFGAGTTTNCVVTITNNVAPAGMLFNANNGGIYTLSGSGSGLLTLSGMPAITCNDNANINAVLQGTGGFNLAGGSTLTLTAANTYSGATTISSGALLISGAGSLGSGNYAGNIADNGAFNYSSTAAQTLSGVLSGSGAVTASGSGTLTLSGANTYSGGTTVSASADVIGLTVANAAALGTSSVLVNGYQHYGNSLTVNSGLTLTNALTLARGAGGTGNAYLGMGSGSIWSGPITVNNAASTGYPAIASSASSSNPSIISGHLGYNALGIANASTPSLVFRGSGGYQKITGALALSTGYVQFLDSAKVEFDNVNNVWGTLDLNNASAVAYVGATNALSVGGVIYSSVGGLLQMNNLIGTTAYDQAIAGLSGNIKVALATGSATLTLSNTANQFQTNVISGAINLVKIGPASQTLAGTNTYSGSTTISAGTLVLGATGSISNSPNMVIISNATLDVSARTSFAFTGSSPVQTLSGGSPAGTANITATGRTVTLSSGAKFSFQGSSNTVGKISVAGNLTLNANAVTINVSGSALVAGTYRLLDCTGTLANTGTFGTPIITGIPLVGTTASISVTPGAAGHVDLVIQPITFTLTYNAGANGTITGTSPQVVNYGASGTAVLAATNSGYVFTNWSDGVTANPRTDANVTSNLTVTANFAELAPLAVTAATPMIANANISPDRTSFTLTGQGAANAAYVLMVATNLPPIWVPVLTNNADDNGVFSFTDLQVTNYPQRFYRVESQ